MAAGRTNILVAESSGFSTRAAELLRQVGDLTLADLDRTALFSAVGATDILWVRLRHNIDAQLMAAAPQLRLIITPTTGLNHIDLTEARRRNIKVLSLQGETRFLNDIRATAEHTIGLMLSVLRQVPAALAHVREGHWERDLFKGRELFGKTVGIIGYGRLGRIVAKYLRAFDTEILVNDPQIKTNTRNSSVSRFGLDDLLHKSDIVTLHVNLSEQTRGLFGKAEFYKMKPGACFVNTARGELVDEAALLDALGTGHLKGAALDVLCNERYNHMGNHPLIVYAQAHDNLIITPHIGGCTFESMEKTELFLAEKLLRSRLDASGNDHSTHESVPRTPAGFGRA